MEEAAPAKRVTVASSQGEMTTEEENNGEFNMAPRGSFNHLIESPACLGFPPSSFAPHLRPVLISMKSFLRKDRRLLKDDFARVLFFLPSPSSLRAFSRSSLSSRDLYLSPAISGRTRRKIHRVSLDRHPEPDERANVPVDPGQQYSNTKGG